MMGHNHISENLALPIRLGSKSGHNGCNVYDANDEFVCSLILPMHQTIGQIRADAETRPETKKNLEIADSIITAVNVMPEVKEICRFTVHNGHDHKTRICKYCGETPHYSGCRVGFAEKLLLELEAVDG